MSENHEHIQIPLDGSYGAGPLAEVTIITKITEPNPDAGRLRRDTYEVPFFLIDENRLMKMSNMNLIVGYQIIKGDRTPSALKEMGL